jgi:hypothetical protein
VQVGILLLASFAALLQGIGASASEMRHIVDRYGGPERLAQYSYRYVEGERCRVGRATHIISGNPCYEFHHYQMGRRVANPSPCTSPATAARDHITPEFIQAEQKLEGVPHPSFFQKGARGNAASHRFCIHSGFGGHTPRSPVE